MEHRKSSLTFVSGICLALTFITAAFLVAASATVAESSAAKPITLVFSHFEPAGASHSTEIFQPWFAEIEKRTGGRVKIEPHYAQELVPLPGTLDAVLKGTVDIAVFLPHQVGGSKFLLDNIWVQPTFNVLGYRPARTYYELFQKFPEMQASYKGVKPVMFFNIYVSYVGTTKKPIRKLEDGAGLKMVMAGAAGQAIGKALGFVPVSSSPPETYSMWERGVADGGGVVNPADLFDNKWGEIIKFITMVPMNRAPLVTIMNQAKFDSLPADIQKVFTDLTQEWVDVADKVEQTKTMEAIARAPKEYGVEFIALPPEEMDRWVAADQPVIDAYTAKLEAAGLPGKKFYATYLELEKKYAAAQYKFK